MDDMDDIELTETQKQITDVLERTIRRFNKNERYLMENKLCERCICAQFAMYLNRSIRRSCFTGYAIDVEYDRGMGGNDAGKKRLFGFDTYLDLIVHKRGYDPITGYDNLFAIEMKWQGEPFESDKDRLRALVDNQYGFNYAAGFAIRIICDDNRSIYELKIEEPFYNRTHQ